MQLIQQIEVNGGEHALAGKFQMDSSEPRVCPNDLDSDTQNNTHDSTSLHPSSSEDLRLKIFGRSRHQKFRTPFYNLEVMSKTKIRITRNARELLEEEINYIAYPNRILQILGVSGAVWLAAHSTTGWQYTIRSFNTLPKDAQIFEFCRRGNLEAVKTLLELGQASLQDRDPDGMTLLHVSTLSCQ
jgi:hypothetical protein